MVVRALRRRAGRLLVRARRPRSAASPPGRGVDEVDSVVQGLLAHQLDLGRQPGRHGALPADHRDHRGGRAARQRAPRRRASARGLRRARAPLPGQGHQRAAGAASSSPSTCRTPRRAIARSRALNDSDVLGLASGERAIRMRPPLVLSPGRGRRRPAPHRARAGDDPRLAARQGGAAVARERGRGRCRQGSRALGRARNCRTPSRSTRITRHIRGPGATAGRGAATGRAPERHRSGREIDLFAISRDTRRRHPPELGPPAGVDTGPHFEAADRRRRSASRPRQRARGRESRFGAQGARRARRRIRNERNEAERAQMPLSGSSARACSKARRASSPSPASSASAPARSQSAATPEAWLAAASASRARSPIGAVCRPGPARAIEREAGIESDRAFEERARERAVRHPNRAVVQTPGREPGAASSVARQESVGHHGPERSTATRFPLGGLLLRSASVLRPRFGTCPRQRRARSHREPERDRWNSKGSLSEAAPEPRRHTGETGVDPGAILGARPAPPPPPEKEPVTLAARNAARGTELAQERSGSECISPTISPPGGFTPGSGRTCGRASTTSIPDPSRRPAVRQHRASRRAGRPPRRGRGVLRRRRSPRRAARGAPGRREPVRRRARALSRAGTNRPARPSRPPRGQERSASSTSARDTDEQGREREPADRSRTPQPRNDERQRDHEEGGEEIVMAERHRGARGALSQLLGDRPERGRRDDRAPGRRRRARAGVRSTSSGRRTARAAGRPAGARPRHDPPAPPARPRGDRVDRQDEGPGSQRPATPESPGDRARRQRRRTAASEYEPLPDRTGRESRQRPEKVPHQKAKQARRSAGRRGKRPWADRIVSAAVPPASCGRLR